MMETNGETSSGRVMVCCVLLRRRYGGLKCCGGGPRDLCGAGPMKEGSTSTDGQGGANDARNFRRFSLERNC